MRRLVAALALAVMALGMIGVVVSRPKPALAAGAATFYASPSSGTYHVGDVIRVGIMINSAGQAINAGEASVTWSSGLQYSFASTSGSVFTTWTSGGGAGPVGSAGSVYFQGGLPHPGFNGSAGRVVTVIFNATQAGTFNVNIAGTQILADDGSGTNVLCCSSGATFVVQAKAPTLPLLTVVSQTHPDPNKWYTSGNVQLNWYATAAVPNYSFSFDHNATGNPTTPNNATTQTSQQLGDGIWYFHLKGTNPAGSSVVNYAIHIDSKPPDSFSVTLDNRGNASNPQPVVNFKASDAVSSIDHYTASIDGGAAFALNPGDLLPKQHPGKHKITVTAFDQAGNQTAASADFNIGGIDPPKILVWPKSLVILQPMDYVGQSEPDDTIHVFLDGKEIDKFVAKTKLAPKDKDQGDGGFNHGITWEYIYHPRLFPGTYKIYFSRVNSVGAESAPSPDYKLQVVAAPPLSIAQTIWKARYAELLLILIIIFEPIVQSLLYIKFGAEGQVLGETSFVRKIVRWRPFSWAKAKKPKKSKLRHRLQSAKAKKSAPIETTAASAGEYTADNNAPVDAAKNPIDETADSDNSDTIS